MNHQTKPDKRPFPWWIFVVFMTLSVILLLDLWENKYQDIRQNPVVDPKFISNNTVRDPLKKPSAHRAGYVYDCNECHQIITPSTQGRDFVSAHEDIQLEHGINNNCYNCHDAQKREFLVGMGREKIPFRKSELLCQKCHGPKYRDWAVGVHGRPSGYWDKSLGKEPVKATCVACHDPHSPKFKPIEPAPAPVRQEKTKESH